jgi:hypothetical protein
MTLQNEEGGPPVAASGPPIELSNSRGSIREEAPASKYYTHEYLKHGLQLVELRPCDKKPVRSAWNTRKVCASTGQDAAFHKRVKTNLASVGLALAFSGLVAIDVDDIEKARPWFAAHGVDLDALMKAPNAVRRESGRPNRTLLLYKSEPMRTRKAPDAGIEFLCATSEGLTVQIAIPPSVNPNSLKPYEWKGDWRHVPGLPDGLRKAWEGVGAADVDPERKATPPDEKGGVVGAICKAYDPREELPHSALPASMYAAMCETVGLGDGDRHAYLKAASGRMDGLKVLEDGAIQIFDATFPGDGAGSMNVFDFMRFSLYASEDSKEDLAQPVYERPSYKKLLEVLQNEPRVRQHWQAEAGFEDLDAKEGARPEPPKTEVPEAKTSRFRLIPVDEFASGPEPEWIIDEIIPRSELMVVFGEPGCGKSFFVADLAASIARGVPWRERQTQQGRVLYISAESASGFRQRWKAYANANGIALEDLGKSLFMLTEAPNLIETNDIRELIPQIQAIGPFAFIVIDTLARATPGANENSGEDMGRALAHCKTIHKVTKALVCLVHHSGKDQARGARGWSGIRGAADTEIEVTRLGNSSIKQAEVSKQRDGEDRIKFLFTLELAAAGVNAKGRQLTSLVVRPAEIAGAGATFCPRGTFPKGSNQVAVYAAVQELQIDGVEKVANKAVVDRAVLAIPRNPNEAKRDQRPANAWRAMKELVENGLLHFVGTDHVSLMSTMVIGTETDFPSEPSVEKAEKKKPRKPRVKPTATSVVAEVTAPETAIPPPVAEPASAIDTTWDDPPAKANGSGQDNVQTLMKQLRTTQEHAEKLANAGLATPELVTQAPIKTLTDISGHQVYAKTLQNEARKWLSAQRAGGNAR